MVKIEFYEESALTSNLDKIVSLYRTRNAKEWNKRLVQWGDIMGTDGLGYEYRKYNDFSTITSRYLIGNLINKWAQLNVPGIEL